MDPPEVSQARDTKRFELLFRFLEQAGAPPDRQHMESALEAAHSEAHRRWEHQRCAFTTSERLRFTFTQLAIPPEKINARSFAQLCNEFESISLTLPPQLLPGAVETLEELASQYRLGLICDTGLTPGRILRQLMQRDGLTSKFARLTFSDELGTTKPHRQNFLYTLSFLDASPEEAVHVGDLAPTDVAGALGAGMQAILCRADGQSTAADDLTADVPVIHHLHELPGLIHRLNENTQSPSCVPT